MTDHLQLHDLSRSHQPGRPPALEGLTLSVARGEAVALLGPSGSGKTTALRLVAGLDTPDCGSVTIGGRDLAGVAPERRGTALMFQRPLLFPHLSVLDNVAFAPRMAGASRRDARATAARFLELVQLGGYGLRSVSELSGGQEQRVALARALAAEPDVLLLDEPFSALDPSLRLDMHQLLAEVRAVVEPTIVLVTHDQAEAGTVADSVAVLVAGRLEQHALPDMLYRRPASLTVSRFLGGVNEVPGEVQSGTHRSAIGALDLSEDVAPGPATLVVRQEAIRLVSATDPAADVVGRVVQVTSNGARRSVSVTTGGTTLTAEVGPGADVDVESSVGLALPIEQRHVVPSSAAVIATAPPVGRI